MLAPRKRRHNRFLLIDCPTSVYRIKCWYQIDGSFGFVEAVEPCPAGFSQIHSQSRTITPTQANENPKPEVDGTVIPDMLKGRTTSPFQEVPFDFL